ncbi:hypothetical protein TNCV_561161 [Trichonephila clavipes]|uniref:Uncharacterized protein n=1 Tax=Trichonephila clavipes TaxID=2585209 RepID=A0A8X6VA38_TRICX|nr:hypothetical protein TNCV_561161 [Trichonephila clavipes]
MRCKELFLETLPLRSSLLTGQDAGGQPKENSGLDWSPDDLPCSRIPRHSEQGNTKGYCRGRGNLEVKVSERDWLVTSSSPVPLNTRLVGERCTLNLWRAQTFYY